MYISKFVLYVYRSFEKGVDGPLSRMCIPKSAYVGSIFLGYFGSVPP